jgi:hypothetical protein
MAVRKPPVYGIWCRADKKFYWLDTGDIPFASPTARILRMLVQRGLIKYPEDGRLLPDEEPYLVMEYKQAQEKNFEIVRIPLHEGIKDNGTPDGTPKKPLWRS